MRRSLPLLLVLTLGFPNPAYDRGGREPDAGNGAVSSSRSHALRAPEPTETGTEQTVARSLRRDRLPPLSAGTEEKLAALAQSTGEALSAPQEQMRHQALDELSGKIREVLETESPAGDPRLAPFAPMLLKVAADEKESFDNRDIAIWTLRHVIRRPEAIEGIGRALGAPDPTGRISDPMLRGDLVDALAHVIAEDEAQLKRILWVLRKILLKKKGEPDKEVREYAAKIRWEIDGIFWEAARLWKTSPKAAAKNRRQAFNGLLLELESFDGEAPLHLEKKDFAWILEKALRTEPDTDQAFHLMVTLTDWLAELENLSGTADLKRRGKLQDLFTSVQGRFKDSGRFMAMLNRRVLPRLAPEALPTDPPLVMKMDAGAEELRGEDLLIFA